MDYHMESKLATISQKFNDLAVELVEVDGGATWNDILRHYRGHPLENLDEYVSDRKSLRR